jgi:hypothetical protein
MSDRSLSGSIALTKLQHVVMEKKGKSGMIKGLFVPLDANMLSIDDKGAVYMPVNVKVRSEADQYGQHGFVSKTIDSKIYKTLDEAGKAKAKELSPILGNIKDFNIGSSNDNDGAMASGVVSEEDDLPF